MAGAFASVIGESWDSLGERRFLFLTLIGFVGAFGFIRLSTRLMRSPRVPWWPGSVVSESGVHVHHLFFGIVLMMAAGGLSFAAGETDGPWYAVYAVLFGIGFGLDDRRVRAVAAPRRRLLVARGPQLDRRGAGRPGPVSASCCSRSCPRGSATTRSRCWRPRWRSATLHFGWVLIAAAKHRLVHALFGVFVPGLALYAGLRLAKPRSVWAKRFYGERRPPSRRVPSTGSGPTA